MVTDQRVPVKKFERVIDKTYQLHDAGLGPERRSSLIRLLHLNGVLDFEGRVFRPSPDAMLEVLKWHADGGTILAVPIKKLAMELRNSVKTVSSLLRGLEEEGRIRRIKSRAPGNLRTIEIMTKPREPLAESLNNVEEMILDVLS